MSIGFSTAQTLVSGVENLLVFWIGAVLIMQTSTAGASITAASLS